VLECRSFKLFGSYSAADDNHLRMRTQIHIQRNPVGGSK
jgi:hypothetical protein